MENDNAVLLTDNPALEIDISILETDNATLENDDVTLEIDISILDNADIIFTFLYHFTISTGCSKERLCTLCSMRQTASSK